MPRLTHHKMTKEDMRPSLAAHIRLTEKDKRRARMDRKTLSKARSRAANDTYPRSI